MSNRFDVLAGPDGLGRPVRGIVSRPAFEGDYLWKAGDAFKATSARAICRVAKSFFDHLGRFGLKAIAYRS
jgi:hypothetical protein